MSSFVPDERNVNGRFEIERSLKVMHQKVLGTRVAKPAKDSSLSGTRTSRRHASGVDAGSRPQSRNRSREVGYSGMSSPPKTLGLARVLSANKKKSARISYASLTHEKNVSNLQLRLERVRPTLNLKEDPSAKSKHASLQKTFKPRISINMGTGEIVSTKPAASSLDARRRCSRPQSAPPTRSFESDSDYCKVYKEAIKDYIIEHNIYAGDKLNALLRSYFEKDSFEHVDALQKAVRDIKVELNIR